MVLPTAIDFNKRFALLAPSLKGSGKKPIAPFAICRKSWKGSSA